jgi:hypothetical protein
MSAKRDCRTRGSQSTVVRIVTQRFIYKTEIFFTSMYGSHSQTFFYILFHLKRDTEMFLVKMPEIKLKQVIKLKD